MTSEDRFMEAINAQIEANNQRRNAELDTEIQEMTLEEQFRFIFKEQRNTIGNMHNWLLRERIFETLVYKNLERFVQILEIPEEFASQAAIKMKICMFDEPTETMLRHFKEFEKKLIMKNNEFFKAISNGKPSNDGELRAIRAWKNGIEKNVNFPFLSDNFWLKEIPDFLEAVKKSGFKRFGFFSTSTVDLKAIVIFMEHGWKIAGTFEFDTTPFEKAKGLIFELED